MEDIHSHSMMRVSLGCWPPILCAYPVTTLSSFLPRKYRFITAKTNIFIVYPISSSRSLLRYDLSDLVDSPCPPSSVCVSSGLVPDWSDETHLTSTHPRSLIESGCRICTDQSVRRRRTRKLVAKEVAACAECQNVVCQKFRAWKLSLSYCTTYLTLDHWCCCCCCWGVVTQTTTTLVHKRVCKVFFGSK